MKFMTDKDLKSIQKFFNISGAEVADCTKLVITVEPGDIVTYTLHKNVTLNDEEITDGNT